LKLIKSNPQITKEEIAQAFSMSESTIARDIKNINNHISIAWKGASKGGHWEIKE
jgi:predicted HTH transcriptional regulator